VLTWSGLAMIASSMVTAARWWPRRRDGLGRARTFPGASVAALAMTGAVLLEPGLQRHQLEATLADAARKLVGVPVAVHCQSAGEEFVDTDQNLGFVAAGPDGMPERRTTLKREVCSALASYLGSDHARPSEDEVRAVHVLSHESRHMAGTADEAMAECQAMQRDATAARLLGADPRQARRLARYYWLVLYHTMPAEYVIQSCAPGASWDEHLPDAPWAGADTSGGTEVS
jgi:hypothetical protein